MAKQSIQELVHDLRRWTVSGRPLDSDMLLGCLLTMAECMQDLVERGDPPREFHTVHSEPAPAKPVPEPEAEPSGPGPGNKPGQTGRAPKVQLPEQRRL